MSVILLAVLRHTWWSEARRFIQTVYFIRSTAGKDKLSDTHAIKTVVPITAVSLIKCITSCYKSILSVMLVIANAKNFFFKWLMPFFAFFSPCTGLLLLLWPHSSASAPQTHRTVLLIPNSYTWVSLPLQFLDFPLAPCLMFTAKILHSQEALHQRGVYLAQLCHRFTSRHSLWPWCRFNLSLHTQLSSGLAFLQSCPKKVN